jgi:hypothetical protein
VCAQVDLSLDVKDFFSSVLRHWQTTTAMVGQAQREAGVRTKECEDLFKALRRDVPMGVGLVSDEVADLVARVIGDGEQHLRRVGEEDFKMVAKELASLLERFLLPVFLTSDNFLEFLHKMYVDCVLSGFGNRVNVGGSLETAESKGSRRAQIEADEYIDTDFLHGQRQRVKTSMVYPMLQKRCAVAPKEVPSVAPT